MASNPSAFPDPPAGSSSTVERRPSETIVTVPAVFEHPGWFRHIPGGHCRITIKPDKWEVVLQDGNPRPVSPDEIVRLWMIPQGLVADLPTDAIMLAHLPPSEDRKWLLDALQECLGRAPSSVVEASAFTMTDIAILRPTLADEKPLVDQGVPDLKIERRRNGTVELAINVPQHSLGCGLAGLILFGAILSVWFLKWALVPILSLCAVLVLTILALEFFKREVWVIAPDQFTRRRMWLGPPAEKVYRAPLEFWLVEGNRSLRLEIRDESGRSEVLLSAGEGHFTDLLRWEVIGRYLAALTQSPLKLQ